MFPAADVIVAVLLCGCWLLLMMNPRWFVAALFVTSPWAGLYITPGWELDAFKAGLIFSPLLLFRGIQLKLLREIRWPVYLLVLYATSLTLWAIIAKEPLQFDSTATVQYVPRLVVQYSVFVLRVLLPFVITSVAVKRSDATSWMNCYVWSMFVLCSYGILQEFTFLVFDTALTPIFRDGIFGHVSELATVNIGGYNLLRVHSFSREPKDLALFCVPALAWLFARVATPEIEQVRTTVVDRIRFLVIAGCALLTFASSLLVMLPLLILGVGAVRPRLNFAAGIHYWIRAGTSIALVAPLLWIATESRVIARFTDAAGSFDVAKLIQPSREGPALEFLLETWPRSAIGFGVGTQAFYLTRYMPKEFSNKVYEYGTAAGVDSLLVGFVADLGLPGLVLLILLLSRALKRRSNQGARWAVKAALVAAALMSLPLNPAQQGSLLWLLLGIQALEKARPPQDLEARSRAMAESQPEEALCV